MRIHTAALISFSIIYILLAVQMTDAGHGTTIFLAPLTPLGMPWILFIVAFIMLGRIPKLGANYVFVLFMASHYVLSFAMLVYMWNDTLPGTERMLRLHPLWMVITIVAYLFPNVYAWVTFITSIKRPA